GGRGQAGMDAGAELRPGLRYVVQADIGPVVHRVAEGLPVVLVVGALVLDRRAALGERRVDRPRMVFVEPGMDDRCDAFAVDAHRGQDAGGGVALTREGTAQDPRKAQAAFAEVFAQPARLALAERGEAVVVFGTERSLAMAYEVYQRHRSESGQTGRAPIIPNPAVAVARCPEAAGGQALALSLADPEFDGSDPQTETNLASQPACATCPGPDRLPHGRVRHRGQLSRAGRGFQPLRPAPARKRHRPGRTHRPHGRESSAFLPGLL